MPVNILSQSVNIKDLLLKARRSLFTKTLLHLLAPKIKKTGESCKRSPGLGLRLKTEALKCKYDIA